MSTNNTVEVHPSNTSQLGAWDGAEGTYWAANADRLDRTIAGYHHALLDAAVIGPGDRILDIGCGAGQTTLDAARLAPAGLALGLDLSAAMLAVARRRGVAAGITNVEFEQADAQVHPFEPGTFDVALSRTGAMFFGDPLAAFTNIAGALRPGGRLALLTWRPLAENEWLNEIAGALAGRPLSPPPDAPGPFSLSEPHRIRDLLGRAGWARVEVEPRDGEMWFGDSVDEALEFIIGLAGWMLDGRAESERDAALATMRRSLVDHHTERGVSFGSAAWLVTATRP